MENRNQNKRQNEDRGQKDRRDLFVLGEVGDEENDRDRRGDHDFEPFQSQREPAECFGEKEADEKNRNNRNKESQHGKCLRKGIGRSACNRTGRPLYPFCSGKNRRRA